MAEQKPGDKQRKGKSLVKKESPDDFTYEGKNTKRQNTSNDSNPS